MLLHSLLVEHTDLGIFAAVMAATHSGGFEIHLVGDH